MATPRPDCRSRWWLLRPLLFSLNSVVVLYADNVNVVPARAALTSALASLVYAVLLWAAAGVLLPDGPTRATFVVICLWATLSYMGFREVYGLLASHLRDLTGRPTEWCLALGVAGLVLAVRARPKAEAGPLRFLVGTAAAVLAAGSGLHLALTGRSDPRAAFVFPWMLLAVVAAAGYYLRRYGVTRHTVEAFVAPCVAILFVTPLVTIWQAGGSSTPTDLPVGELPTAPTTVVGTANGRRPDIYWIVLDAYGRADTLARLYGHDNGGFLQFLRDRGFWVGDCSRSNYTLTPLSLSATLNFEYHDLSLLPRNKLQQVNWFTGRIRDSRLVRFLGNEGYRTVALASSSACAELPDADVFVTAPARLFGFPIEPSPFEALFVDATIFADRASFFGLRGPFARHRDRVLNVVRHLPFGPSDGRPSFVVAHVLCPHPPFVFDADGAFVPPSYPFTLWGANDLRNHARMTSEEYAERYREQLRFVNDQVKAAVERLVALDPQPVIIVQGDHGPGAYTNLDDVEQTDLDERFGILNAIFLPGRPEVAARSTLSSVNTFRLVLHEVFGADLPLLPDRSFFAAEHELTRVTEVTDRLTRGPGATGRTERGPCRP